MSSRGLYFFMNVQNPSQAKDLGVFDGYFYRNVNTVHNKAQKLHTNFQIFLIWFIVNETFSFCGIQF